MAELLRAHTVANFPRPGAGGNIGQEPYINMIIEGDPGPNPFDGFIHLLLSPFNYGINLATNVGEVLKGDPTPYFVPAGVLQFSGSKTAKLPRVPYYSQPQFNVLFSFDLNGDPLPGNTLGFNLDGNSGQIAATQEFHGAVAYTEYVARAMKLIYKPLVGNNGQSREYGVIAAFYPPTKELITYEVQPIDFQNGDSLVEIYRRVSRAVTTRDGEFEKPPNYPTDGIYPDDPLVIDIETSLETKRVHEIGYMDAVGRGFSRSYFVPKLAPYDLNTTYQPTIVCEVSPLGNTLPKALQDRAKSLIAARGYGCK